MFFVDYTQLEEKVFLGVKSFFESLDPIGSSDYKSGFDDLVSQFGSGGEEYSLLESTYADVIEAAVEKAYGKLSEEDKSGIASFYEAQFLENYYHSDSNEYVYSEDDLFSAISGRFTSWICDNYSIDDYFSDEEADDEIDEDIPR